MSLISTGSISLDSTFKSREPELCYIKLGFATFHFTHRSHRVCGIYYVVICLDRHLWGAETGVGGHISIFLERWEDWGEKKKVCTQYFVIYANY